MASVVKRGYCAGDEKEFGLNSIEKLHNASKDLFYLLNAGYNIKGASVFVGNHYLLSERQRLAIVRAVSPEKSIEFRKEKECYKDLEGKTVYIDGFNTIITLEVALSNSTLIKCMDGTIRDLAGLRGTYKLIDKTDEAIMLIGKELERLNIGEAVFYLDAPVSNSGRLKMRIIELLEGCKFKAKVENINNVDSTLEKLGNVITSDAIILDKCESYINLNRYIIENNVERYSYIDFIS